MLSLRWQAIVWILVIVIIALTIMMGYLLLCSEPDHWKLMHSNKTLCEPKCFCVLISWGEVTHLFKLMRSEPSLSHTHIPPTKLFSCASCHILSLAYLSPVSTYFHASDGLTLNPFSQSELGYEPLFVLVLFVLNFMAEWVVYWLKWICWWSGIQCLSLGMLRKIWLISKSGSNTFSLATDPQRAP